MAWVQASDQFVSSATPNKAQRFYSSVPFALAPVYDIGMKKLLLALTLVFFGQLAVSAPYVARLDTSVTNITSSFQALSMGTPNNIDAIFVDNRSAIEIGINCTTRSSKVAPTGTFQTMYVNASTSRIIPFKVGLGSVCWVKSMGATISTGIVIVEGYDVY